VSFSRCNEFPPRITVYVDGRKMFPETDDLTQLNDQSALIFANRQPTPREIELRRAFAVSWARCSIESIRAISR
jgi:hypothetical protein